MKYFVTFLKKKSYKSGPIYRNDKLSTYLRWDYEMRNWRQVLLGIGSWEGDIIHLGTRPSFLPPTRNRAVLPLLFILPLSPLSPNEFLSLSLSLLFFFCIRKQEQNIVPISITRNFTSFFFFSLFWGKSHPANRGSLTNEFGFSTVMKFVSQTRL